MNASRPRRFAALRGSIDAIRSPSAALVEFHQASPFGKLIERAFAWAQLLSPASWIWGTRAYSHSLPEDERKAFEQRRSRGVDWYIFAWFLFLISSHVAATFLSTAWLRPLVCGLGVWRGADILQANINMHVFDGVRLGGQRHHVTSLVRSSLISVWNYVELIGWYATFYFFSGGLEGACGGKACLFDAIYFSTITQLTIGFGDLKPTTSLGRLLAMSQGLLGTLFLVFAISRFASLLPQVGQDGKNGDEKE